MLKSRFNLTDTDIESKEEEASDTGDEVVADEENIAYPERKLNRSEIGNRLSMLGKTAEGDGYTYLKASCVGMSLTELSAIKRFKHLQFVDVSNNKLTLGALQTLTELPYLLLLQADKNLLESIALKRMPYLQVIIANYNQIHTIKDVYQPELSTLELANNKIKKIDCQSPMPTMTVLDLRNNFIQDIENINFVNLDSLYLAGNNIKSLAGLEKLIKLRILHVRNNPIKQLVGFDEAHTKLQYVNLRNCKVTFLNQVKKLRVLKALEVVILKGCPYMGGTGEEKPEAGEEEDDAELRVEVLAALPWLKRLNKAVYSPEERNEAKDLIMQWIEEGEKDKEEQEEEQEEGSVE